jgi:CopG family nickel-responsive transcriptional regulator
MGLARTTLAIDEQLLSRFDDWMKRRGYTNRSEAMRDLLRAELTRDQAEDAEAEIVAVLSVIFDHEARDLAQELTHIQHQDHHAILCSQHVHLDHHNCLECIIMQGPAGRLRRVADAISSTRGVRVGQLTYLSDKV